jgi:hypothetical protein
VNVPLSVVREGPNVVTVRTPRRLFRGIHNKHGIHAALKAKGPKLEALSHNRQTLSAALPA